MLAEELSVFFEISSLIVPYFSFVCVDFGADEFKENKYRAVVSNKVWKQLRSRILIVIVGLLDRPTRTTQV